MIKISGYPDRIYISKGNSTVSFYLEGFDINGDYKSRGYLGYSVKDALRLYKKEMGLRYKHNIEIIDRR